MHLRFATIADITPLVALINAAYVAEAFFVHGDRTTEAEVREKFNQRTGRFLLVETADALTGAVRVDVEHGAAHLSLLSVHPSAQGRGLGRFLVAAVEAYATELGCHTVELEAFNLRADLPPFYASCGYTNIGTREFAQPELLKMPAHFEVMHKSLDVPAPTTSLHIDRATPSDLADIQAAYTHGRTMQLALSDSAWPGFTDEQVLGEMSRGELYCIRDGATLTGIFSMVENDAAIWDTRELDQHLYLHHITRAPHFAGRGLFDALVRWAHAEARRRGRSGLRMDTWATNETLLRYYTSRGFTMIGTKRMPADPRLSPHYHGIELALLEAETFPLAPVK